MTKGIYIASTEDNSWKFLISLGMMQNLLGKKPSVGFFKPIAESTEMDHHAKIMKSYFQLKQEYEDMIGISKTQLVQMLNQGKSGEVIDLLISKYKKIEESSDFVLVEGTDFIGDVSFSELDINY